MLSLNQTRFINSQGVASKNSNADDIIIVEVAADPAKLPHTDQSGEKFLSCNGYHGNTVRGDTTASDSLGLDDDQKIVGENSKKINRTGVQNSAQIIQGDAQKIKEKVQGVQNDMKKFKNIKQVGAGSILKYISKDPKSQIRKKMRIQKIQKNQQTRKHQE